MINLWQRLTPRWRRGLAITAVTGVALFGVDLLTVIGFSLAQPALPAKTDAIIVLGAKVGTPALQQRALTGLADYQTSNADTLVLSGGRGADEATSEAQAMADVIKTNVAKQHGKMPHLVLETTSTDTFQNIANSKSLAPNAKTIVVVSDSYHLARSVATAKHSRFQHVYWDAPKPSYYSNSSLAVYYIREAVALVVYAPRLIF